MKKMKLLQIMALCLTLSSCESCEEQEWDTLPPETQKGANTFGCYVNGELFVKEKEAMFTPPQLNARYDQLTKILSISCTGRDKTGSIDLVVLEPEKNIKSVLHIANLSKMVVLSEKQGTDNITIQYVDIVTYIGKKTGEIILTQLDTINRIVSGRFQFQSQYIDKHPNTVLEGDTIIFVTNGRFDAKLRLSDNDY